MIDKPSILRETDADAIRLACQLLRGQRSGALAVQEPGETGFPFISRVLVGLDIDGAPVILTSRLAVHTQALLLDPRASLLVGRLGKGDPLAHARMTVQCEAQPVTSQDTVHMCLRTRFLRRHPKAELYIDFPDFLFFRLLPIRASLNAGFGRAYAIPGSDLMINSPLSKEILAKERVLLEELNSNRNAIAKFVDGHARGDAQGWLATGIDAAGVDLALGDELYRSDYAQPLENLSDIGI